MKLGVSYIAAHLPDHIKADMDHLAGIGCQEVLFAVQENHFRYLNGAVRFGPGIAKAQGLKPLAVIWGFANTFGGGRISKRMLENIGLWRKTRDGQPVGNACLNNPQLLEFYIELVRQCNEHGFKGLTVDEPQRQECFCEHCRKKFHDACGLDLIRNVNSKHYEPFRLATVREFVAASCRAIKAINPALSTTVVMMPKDAKYWPQIANIPDLDVFGTDPYWLVPEVQTSLEQALDEGRMMRALCQKLNKKSELWLNCWWIPKGREPEIYEGGKKLAELGCDTFYTWSYRAGLGTNEESADPQKAWEYLCRLYRELAGL